MTLATEDMKLALAELEVYVVRAGIAIDHRALARIDDLHACIADEEKGALRVTSLQEEGED